MKSIMQTEKECFICRSTRGLEEHHCIHGTGRRKLAEKYGLKVWLCKRHHTGDMYGNDYAVHFNKKMDDRLKQTAQKAFEKHYPELKFLEVFGRSYL